ncbi:hypothetical protein LSH36_1011g00013 [Paralvinella palmiformis]|uniref:FAD dependent oxidoreductase domain-containing protein n=1 Tax=Paralvinella palmiformis TaxID=53620 RepID=A0AAD9IWM9_9ANNE|nr:hypothetical protein LSH36_1011g00013 [Paralvinella palmiformis]
MAQQLLSLMGTKTYHPQKTTLMIGVSRDTIHCSASPQQCSVGKNEFLSMGNNKQMLINIISSSLRDIGCDVINCEGDAECEIMHPAIAASEYGSTTLIGEDTDLIPILQLQYIMGLCSEENVLSELCSEEVYTAQGRHSCRRVVITSGSWTNHVLGSLGARIPLKVTQEQVTYYATPHIKQFTKERFPVFIFHGDVDYYGMPCHVNSGSKLGMDNAGPEVTPETRTYDPCPVRENHAKAFLEKHIPTFLGPKMYTKTCLYDMTLDRDFVVDSLACRGKSQVIICNGAAHAFKFSCLLGKILSQLAIDGSTEYDISGFRFDRPAIADPDNYRDKSFSWYAKL